MSQFAEAGTPINFSADQIVSKAPGTLLGFYVNSTSSGTIVIYNGTTAGGTALSGTITPAIGYHRFPAFCTNSCFIAVTGGSANVTAFFAAG